MAVHVIQPQQFDFRSLMAQVLGDQQATQRERERMAQQESQFTREMEARAPLVTAQTEAQRAAAEAARAGITDAERGRTFEENKAGIDWFLKNAYEPLIAAGRLDEAEGLRLSYAQQNPLAGWSARPATTLDEANANLAQWKADVTSRVAGGTQNVADINLATKLGTGDQLSTPAFESQEQREMGPEPFAESVAIKGDRTAGATPRLQAKTQRDIVVMQVASNERIADANRRSDELIAAAKIGAKDPKTVAEGEEMRNLALSLARDLVNHPGLDTATGIKGPSQWFGPLSAGTEGSIFTGKLDQLRALLTFDNLQKIGSALKGPTSDRDMALLSQLSGALEPSKNSNKSMRDELTRVGDALERGAGENLAAVPEGTVRELNGVNYRKVAGGWQRVP